MFASAKAVVRRRLKIIENLKFFQLELWVIFERVNMMLDAKFCVSLIKNGNLEKLKALTQSLADDSALTVVKAV